MTEAVVDLFEVVHVDDDEPAPSLGTTSELHVLCGECEKAAAVVQARQLIAKRQTPHLRQELFLLLERGLELLGSLRDARFQALVRRAQRLLRHHAVRQVTCYFDELANLPALIRHRGHHDVSPEPSAILPHAPTFVLYSALLPSQSQNSLGGAGFTVLRGVKARKMPSQDLVIGIPLQQPGAGIPRDHVAVGVHHENGIVPDALDEEADMLIVTPRFLGCLALRDVTRNATRVHEFPVLPEHIGADQHIPD